MLNRLVLLGVTAASLALADDAYLKQSRGAGDPKDLDAWKAAETLPAGLKPYPPAPPGTPNPPEPLYRFGGRGPTSYGAPTLDETFAAWRVRLERQRAQVDAAARRVLESRFDLTCKAAKGVTMSRSKSQPIGPTARLPKGFSSWEAYAQTPASQLRARDDFPWRPLDHPLQSTAHMVFPKQWTTVHPEHERFDVGFDVPDCFLPEYPPPLYLTTHAELGDVTRGVEITYGNYFELFNGVLTAEQLEGLRLLLTPFQTTWFNVTHHRVTPEPSQGVACLSCHVNGHSNGAFALAPDNRPNYARLRVDTPTMRGNWGQIILSSKRSIRTLDHFAEVEEYFDGDTALLAAIGGRTLQKSQTNRMGDFNAIIDFPPAPKLSVLGTLNSLATEQEKRGEALFAGKARCAVCHPPATHFSDQSMHDLQVERFYPGRAEGPIKTFPLRGIKDSPPYLHDGRLLTLEDAVLFFDVILETKLSAHEKVDLVAYLRAL